MNKRGLSDIVTTILIILISIVAISVVWIVLSNFLEGNKSQIEFFDSIATILSIPSSSVQVDNLPENRYVIFNVKLDKSSREISGIKIVLEDESGKSGSYQKNIILKELETQNIRLQYGNELGKIVKINVYPIFKDDSGKEIIGTTSSQFIVDSNVPLPKQSEVLKSSPEKLIINSGETKEATISNGEEGYIVFQKPNEVNADIDSIGKLRVTGLSSTGKDYKIIKVRDNSIPAKEGEVQVIVNGAPTANIIYPLNEDKFMVVEENNLDINLKASASDDESVTKVEFFNGNDKLCVGVMLGNEWSCTWNVQGSKVSDLTPVKSQYNIIARATDNKGLSEDSNSVRVIITSIDNTALVGYWKFDENSGTTAFDSSGNSHHGTLKTNKAGGQLSSHLVESNCKIGKCLWFKGIEKNYVLVPTSSDFTITSAGTIEFWAYPTGKHNLENLHMIIGKGEAGWNVNDYNMFLAYGDNGFGGSIADGVSSLSYYGPRALRPDYNNRWYYVAFTWDTNSELSKIYLNGELVGTKTTKIIPRNTVTSLSIGSPNNGNNKNYDGYHYNGYLDEVMLYNRALSAEEVKSHFDAME